MRIEKAVALTCLLVSLGGLGAAWGYLENERVQADVVPCTKHEGQPCVRRAGCKYCTACVAGNDKCCCLHNDVCKCSITQGGDACCESDVKKD